MKRLSRFFICLSYILLVTLLAASCSPFAPQDNPNPAGSTPRPVEFADTGEKVPAPTATPFICPVTIANGDAPPLEKRDDNYHGNGKLWVAPWPEGTILATPDYVRADGSIGMKFPWWRGVKGELSITGLRLDAKAPPLEAEIPDGYGDSGFQAAGLIFPTEGCWEVTGAVGEASLTIVTLVVKVPE
jgi:hypothetical protein